MVSTTEAAIRDRIIELIRALVPEVDTTTTFRLYEEQRGANFRRYARGAPQAAARMFQVRSVPTRQSSDAGNADVEARLVTFDVIVAYPQTHRWGSAGARDRDRARESDQKLIENAIGRNGYANFTGPHPNASWLGEAGSSSQTATTWELSDAEGAVDFLVVRQTMRYFRANTPTWTVDATSGIGVPADATEWGAVMSAAGISSGGPSLLWLCQEASGNLTDSIGSFTGTASGTGLSYQNAVTGWSRLAINTPDAGSGLIANTDSGLPDIGSSSCLLLAYAKTSVPAATRGLSGVGANLSLEILVGKTLRLFGFTSGTGTSDTTGQVRPYVVQANRSTSTANAYSDQEKLSIAIGAVSGKRVGIGATVATTVPASYLYAVAFTGTAAELSDTQIKALLETLGWNIPWS